MTTETTSTGAGPSRRTVLAGAAWSVPVVAVAIATPARAASGDDLGRLVLETATGGSWVNPEYYGASIQLRNDDTHATSTPVADITSGTVTVTFARVDVGDVQPAVIANAGGSSPSVPSLPATDPTWTAAGAVDNGDGTVTYTLLFSGSIAGQGLSRVTFGILGPSPLHSGIDVTVRSTGSPTDGWISEDTYRLY
ncbi:hypothetical protein L2X99_07865 [Microbacterium sp. KUDC0406]|uniref:hypothetical protein n=1 Tax=Microbacterium sp. KUDC0406 TaxID=2909588 RepID=UPI001F2ADF19|nr:hypothetical protein [Microbacterium sp. KUDC0406]UJP11414.1 hypothetical protein L2X99_07865 [Microbacterium sp. KUDC0406]